MSKKAMMGFGGGILAVVAVVVIYLVGFSGVGGPAGDNSGGDRVGKARAEKLFAGVASSERFRAGSGKVTWDSADARGDARGDEGVLIKNIRIAGKDEQGRDRRIAIDAFTVNKLDWNRVDGSPYADVEIRGLRSPQFSEAPQLKQFMAAAGMKEFVLDLKVRYRYAESDRLMDLQDVEIAVRELGAFTVRAKIHGLDIAAIRNMWKSGKVDSVAALGMLALIRVGSVAVSFKDSGAVDKAMTLQAGKTGGDKDNILQGVVSAIEALKADLPIEIVRKAADAVVKFLKNRRSITVKADPESPVSVLKLMMSGRTVADADRIAQQLNLSVGAE